MKEHARLTKLLVISFCLMLVSSSCTQDDVVLDNTNTANSVAETINTDDTHSQRDLFTDPSIYRQSTSLPGGFAESETGIYYALDNFLYYADANSNEFTVLCGRPECEHKDEDCDAYILTSSFTIYNDEIYHFESSTNDGVHTIELWKRQLDGSHHEKVKDVIQLQDSTVKLAGYFHQGYYYYPYMNIAAVTTGYPGDGLYRTSLDSDGELEKVLDVNVLDQLLDSAVLSISFYENSLYIVGSDGLGAFDLWEHDLDTNQMTKLIDDWSIWGNLFTDEIIYYYHPRDGFYEYDIESKQSQHMASDPLDDRGIDSDAEFGAYYTEQYILLIELRFKYRPEAPKIFVFNWDYELLNEFTVQSDDFSIVQPKYLATTSDSVYFIESSTRNHYELINYLIPVDSLLEEIVPIYQVDTYR